MIQSGKIQFRQYLCHDIENERETEKYLETALPLIVYIVMYFNSLEQSLIQLSENSLWTGPIVLACFRER